MHRRRPGHRFDLGAPLRLLVLGGTVFLGRHVVETALARGHDVTLFNRGRSRPELFPDVERLTGDRNDDLSVLRNRGWDAVFDPSCYTPRQARSMTQALAGSIGHYTLVSSISVYPIAQADKSEPAPVDQLDDPTSEDVQAHYGALKALSEAAAEEVLPGVVVHLRAGLLVGPPDPSNRFTYWPVRVRQGGEVLAPGDPADEVEFIDARDVAGWALDMAERNQTGTFNVTGPAAPVGLGTVLETCRTVTGSDARFTWVDSDFLLEQAVGPWMEMPLWLPPSVGSLQAPIDRALRAGLRHRPLDQTIRDTLEWAEGSEVSAPQLDSAGRVRQRAGLTPEKETAVLQAWRSRTPAAS